MLVPMIEFMECVDATSAYFQKKKTLASVAFELYEISCELNNSLLKWAVDVITKSSQDKM